MKPIVDIRKWRLYVITDERLSKGRSHVEIARSAIEGGADVIQLRDKTSTNRRLYEEALEIRRLTREAGVIFIINDRIDVALAVDADGVHLGDDDFPPDVTRRLIGKSKIMGISATTLEEAIAGEKAGADYLGVGPVYEARGTKPEAVAPRGVGLITAVRAAVKIPIVSIGGLGRDNIHHPILAGADCAASVSAVVTADDVAATVRELTAKIIAAKAEQGNRIKSE